jgi:Eukaryotic aspartyl protease
VQADTVQYGLATTRSRTKAGEPTADELVKQPTQQGGTMPQIIRMPINNVLLGSDYTGVISIGEHGVAANLILDTGSSTLAVQSKVYNPTRDPAAKTTKIAQEVQYGSGSWVGAVVRTSVAVAADARLSNVNLAVTYHESADMFGKADGIFGLAYEPLNNAFLMTADTWKAKYNADQITHGKEADLDPYFSQLEEVGIVANLFAFYTKRSIVSAATANPATDPLNQGVFVIGGGPQCDDLYTGTFTSVAVLDDVYYNTNLLSVQVGDQPPIRVPPLAPGAAGQSNSIVDSGTNSLVFAQGVYDQLIRSFGNVNDNFANALTQYSIAASQGVAQNQIDLASWPDLRFTLQGADGSPVVLTVTPGNYWQFDALQRGQALANMYGDDGSLGGQSILGLPLMNGYYTVFDRTAASGHGVINFATRS